MGDKTALIFGSVAYPDWRFLAPLQGQNLAVLCADGGIRCAALAGFAPDFYIGDGDSGGSAQGLPAILLPAEKDLTDLQAACEAAIDQGASNLILTACTGGRQDHHLANLQLLETLAKRGVRAVILDPWNEITYFSAGTRQVPRGGYRYFSLLPITKTLEGLTITGAKYPLENAMARRGDSLTVSNEVIAASAEITLRQGACWLIRSEPLAL